MSSSFSPNSSDFLPETFIIPDDPEELKVKLSQYFNQIAVAVNGKGSGLHVTEETLTGNRFIPTFGTQENTNTQYRDIFRVVIDTGALPNASTSLTAHGITTTQNFSLVPPIAGGATHPGVSTMTEGIPLPYINTTTPADSVQVSMDETNIKITTTTANYTSFTRSFVIIEYIKEV